MISFFVSILKFKEEHPFWLLLIGGLIFSYFAPVPYLHDILREIARSFFDLLGVGIKR